MTRIDHRQHRAIWAPDPTVRADVLWIAAAVAAAAVIGLVAVLLNL